MRAAKLGRILFAAGIGGIGVVNLVCADFALQWQPVPFWVPAHEVLAVISGILLIACGIGLLLPRRARLAAIVTAAYVLSWVVLLQIPQVAADPATVVVWLPLCEDVALMCGAVLFLSLREGVTRAVRIGRFVFGLCCVVFGLSHFVYPAFTAATMPAWLPEREILAYATGGVSIAAGAGIMLAILPRPAATAQAVMMSILVVLVNAAGVAETPDRSQWTLLVVALALTGVAWLVAATFGTQGEAEAAS